jgi:hypothetical protein
VPGRRYTGTAGILALALLNAWLVNRLDLDIRDEDHDE